MLAVGHSAVGSSPMASYVTAKLKLAARGLMYHNGVRWACYICSH